MTFLEKVGIWTDCLSYEDIMAITNMSLTNNACPNIILYDIQQPDLC